MKHFRIDRSFRWDAAEMFLTPSAHRARQQMIQRHQKTAPSTRAAILARENMILKRLGGL